MADLSALTAHVRPSGRLRQAREKQILAAATHIFAAKGFDGTTTSDIAVAAGLPKANVHYYFGTKEKLYRAILEDILKAWLEEADHWITAGRPPRIALAGYIKAKLALSRDRPEASRIYANELLRGAPHIKPYLHFALRERVASLSAVIAGWVAAGSINPVDPAHLLFCIWAMTQTYADFAVQVGAVLDRPVLDRPALDDATFETASRTITAMVLGSLLTGEKS